MVFKTLYSNYLKSYKKVRYLDDIDLKMFKKNEIFKYKYKNEPDFIYNQYICVTDNKKIILKTKHNNYEEFNSLTDFIATSSTSLKDILTYMNKNFLNEIKIQCILNIKDFEAKIDSPNAERNKLSVCKRAYEDGLINKYGSIFKLLKLTDKKILFENSSGSPIYKIHEIESNNKKFLNNKNVMNMNNENKKFPNTDNDIESNDYSQLSTYQTDEFNLNQELNKFIENYMNKNEYYRNMNKNPNKEFSSFIEVSSSTKFYSNDLLIKIEDGMNHITEKIIDSSKKISELSK